MKLTVAENDKKNKWYKYVRFNIWKDRNIDDMLYSTEISRKKITMALLTLVDTVDKNISEEATIVMRNIVDLICIIYYEKEYELELVVGEQLDTAKRISFKVSSNDLVKLLQNT